ILTGAIGLDVSGDIRERRIEFPTQAVVEGQVGLNLPAILREWINGGGANILPLSRPLGIGIGQTQKVFCIIIPVPREDGVGSGIVKSKFAVDVEIIILIEAGTANV